MLAKLERLQKLREKGALTDAEFEAQKARILSLTGSDPVRTVLGVTGGSEAKWRPRRGGTRRRRLVALVGADKPEAEHELPHCR